MKRNETKKTNHKWKSKRKKEIKKKKKMMMKLKKKNEMKRCNENIYWSRTSILPFMLILLFIMHIIASNT